MLYSNKKQKNSTNNQKFSVMDEQFIPTITAELANEVQLECSVKIKGVKKDGVVRSAPCASLGPKKPNH